MNGRHQAGSKHPVAFDAKEPRHCSFDRHDNFVSANHVEPCARSRLDSARVAAQTLHFLLNRSVIVAQPLDVGADLLILLRGRAHLRSRAHGHRDAQSESCQNDYCENCPRRNYSATAAYFRARADDLGWKITYRSKVRKRACGNTLRTKSVIPVISIRDPVQGAPPSLSLIHFQHKRVRAAPCPKGASEAMTHLQK